MTIRPLVALIVSLLVNGQTSAGGQDHATGAAVQDLPIFDAHIHYKQPAWSAYSVESIIELMDKSGVAMGLVSSTPDEGTIRLWEHAPNRIVPELRPYHGAAGSSNWMKSSGMREYLEQRLDSYPHQGIGEFHIHQLNTDDEVFFREIISLANARDIYLHVHSGTEPIRWLYSLDPTVKMIWAHAGLSTSAEDVYELMSDYPELVADTSLRERDILDDSENLNPEWEKIINAFSNRLLVGSDTWVNSQWDNYENIIDSNRVWLSLLSRDTAEKIAYKNAERLFKREISMDLIGQK